MNTKSLCALVAAALLAGCETAPAPRPAAHSVAVPGNLTQVYFYAQRGQSQSQQDRDHYECFNWAVQQTGYDPSRRAAPADHPRQIPVQANGATVVGGTLMGAAIGAAVSDPWHRGEGAAVGAIAGTALGALAASSQANAINTAQKQVPAARAGYEQQAAQHRRAMSACLEGRGYVVK
ncbi:MAG: glycine zipper family protein [Pseudomonadota bacterium]